MQGKSNTTRQHNRPDIQHTVDNDNIGYGELAQKIRFSITYAHRRQRKLNISMQLVATSLDLVLNIFIYAPTTTYSKDLKSADERGQASSP